MKKPRRRQDGERRSDNAKRKLLATPDPDALEHLAHNVQYGGRGKHKQHPHAFGLEPEAQQASDRTTCDGDAGFRPEDMESIVPMMQRGIQAGLVGHDRMRVVWAVSNNGWVFEARVTNDAQSLYHGYPLRPEDPVAERIVRRYLHSVSTVDSVEIQHGAQSACERYGIKFNESEASD